MNYQYQGPGNQMPQNYNPYNSMNQFQNYPINAQTNTIPQYQQNFPMIPPQVSGTSQQNQGIIGRVVNDFSEITANDVPMNGDAAFFPKSDGSEMQVRSWASNGTIQTIVYKPVLPENTQEGNIPQMDFNALNEDVRALREEISERFDRLEKSMGGMETKKTTSRAKKEVNSDE